MDDQGETKGRLRKPQRCIHFYGNGFWRELGNQVLRKRQSPLRWLRALTFGHQVSVAVTMGVVFIMSEQLHLFNILTKARHINQPLMYPRRFFSSDFPWRMMRRTYCTLYR